MHHQVLLQAHSYGKIVTQGRMIFGSTPSARRRINLRVTEDSKYRVEWDWGAHCRRIDELIYVWRKIAQESSEVISQFFLYLFGCPRIFVPNSNSYVQRSSSIVNTRQPTRWRQFLCACVRSADVVSQFGHSSVFTFFWWARSEISTLKSDSQCTFAFPLCFCHLLSLFPLA